MFLSKGSTFVKQNKDRNSKTKNVDNSAFQKYTIRLLLLLYSYCYTKRNIKWTRLQLYLYKLRTQGKGT